MTEIIVKRQDGKSYCYLLHSGEVYEMRGDEITVRVTAVIFR